jgi:hypothetical protein
MKFNKKTFRFIAAIIITTILLLPSVLQAKEINLKDAIDWGIQHNYDLEEIRYNIETLERDLEILDADKAFQVNLDVTPIWGFGGGKKVIFPMKIVTNLRLQTKPVCLNLKLKKLLQMI